MKVLLDHKDLARYPFLKESQLFASEYAADLSRFLASPLGGRALNRALERVRSALAYRDHARQPADLQDATDDLGIRLTIASYGLARILVSCAGDRQISERLCRYEAGRAYSFLIEDEPAKKEYVAESLGLRGGPGSISLPGYTELSAGMREDRWRLVNRCVEEGNVLLEGREAEELIRERIRVVLLRQLPLAVPTPVCSQVSPWVEEMTAAAQEQVLASFGAIEEDLFPPCISAIIAALSAGTNITHAGRFALTAFLHNVGMDTAGIVSLFGRAPDFDPSRTLYQVEHIGGRGGSGYTAPACAAMRTNGLCVNQVALCGKVNHPLSYYRIRKQKAGRSARPPDAPGQAGDREI